MKQKKTPDQHNLKQDILQYFKNNTRRKLAENQLAKKIGREVTPEFKHALHSLTAQGILSKTASQQYYFSTSAKQTFIKYVEGRLDLARSGAGYVIVENQPQDVYIPAKYLNMAMARDIVKVQMHPSRKFGKPQGEIVQIVKRFTEQIIGTVFLSKKKITVTPANPLIPFDILIKHYDGEQDLESGAKVVIKVTNWDYGHNTVLGEIMEVLPEGDRDYAMKSILISKGFNLHYPEEAREQSEAIPAEISSEEIKKRRDFRQVLTFTIDPATAKDFDDALSYQVLPDESIEVGVHIADVTHYLQPGSALDQEAFRRATSVYLVDRVLPMLPEKLSNDLCSLNPHTDKLTFSAVFVFNRKLDIIQRWFGKTIIHSDQRFSYEEAQKIIDHGKGKHAQPLKELNRIAQHLRQKNIKGGAIQFETDEVQFELNEDGEPISLFVKERKETHLLIEDFMLLANREVATLIAQKGRDQEIPLVYRVHDLPDPDKIGDFALFAQTLGYQLDTQTPLNIAKSLNRIQEAARKDERLHILAPLAIRSMAKAVYTTNNIGHFGLGFKFYTHFTSPIRRYADVLVHRILEKNLEAPFRMKKSRLEEQCKYISNQERMAVEAERESTKYMQVRYLEKFIGETFEGLVSGIIDRGFFVELMANKCEGLVPFNSLEEAFSVADNRLRAMGLHSGKVITFGQKVKVRVTEVDTDYQEIDLELVSED